MRISSTASSVGSAPSTSEQGVGRTSRTALAIVAFVLAVASVPETAAAQDPNLIDQGRFDIRLGDRAAGTETFAIRRQGEGYMAVGRVQLEGAGAWLRSSEFGLRTDGTFTPVRYETRAVGDAESVIASRTGTRIRITTSTSEGERLTELLASPDMVLLGPGIAQHYYFVVRRLSAGRGGGLTALIPGEGREVPIRVVGTSDTTLDLGGRSIPARRWELDLDGTTHLVWSDPSDGRILRVEIPDRQWRSVRRAD